MRERIVRMNLNRQRLFGEQQLEQQPWVWRFQIGALKPELADRDAVRLNIAPWQEVGAPPGFAHNSRAGMLDRHDVLQYGADGAGIGRENPACGRRARSLLTATYGGRIAKRLQAFKTRAAICGASCAPGMLFFIFISGRVSLFSS